MQSMRDLLRLGVGGLFLEPTVFREQRAAPDGLRRGFILVVLIGLLVGFATMIGQLGANLLSPNFNTVTQTLYNGLIRMPWYEQASRADVNFAAEFRQSFDQTMSTLGFLNSNLAGVLSFVLTPFLFLLGWLIFGVFAHLMARLLGGQATLGQTLGCTALASGANLLGLVQIVPFARLAGISGVMLLSLLANYLAIREAHKLAPWRAFWVAMIGPLLLVLLLVGLYCAWFVLLINTAAQRTGGLSL